MKKFYYKKDASLDKTPIIVRLERRHTLDVDKNDQGCVATRTKSASSIHLPKDEPDDPKPKTREITKSLSEDVLSRGHIRKSAKIITETDLSSSWLYKARKASMNSKGSPQKTPQPTGLSPVALTDPKLKPVPVRSSVRSKKSHSCLCYVAIMMSISFCTIGVLAAVTGILYKEIFSFQNLTSAETSELMTDISDFIPEPRSLNDSETNEFNFINETTKQTPDSTDSNTILGGNGTTRLNEDQSQENIPKVGFGNLMNVTDLSQLLDSRKVEIKFKDGDTTIYEMNSSNSSEHENSANNLEMKELNINGNKKGKINELSTSEDINTLSNEVTEKENKELENLDTFINSQSRILNVFTDTGEEQRVLDTTLNVDQLNEFSMNSSSNAAFEGDMTFGSPLENNKSELFNSEASPFFAHKLDDRALFDKENRSISEQSENAGEVVASNDLINFKTDEQKSENEMYEDQHITNFKNTDAKILAGKGEHDVESMLLVIDEPEEMPDTFSIRNGEISPPFEAVGFKLRNSSSSFEMKNGVDGSISQLTRSQEQQSLQEDQHMKPLDMKVSLAEAMKHLQVLDINNKILTSRMKPDKPKPRNTQNTKLSENSLSKQNITIEKMKYLQNLRLVLQENLLRT